MLFGSPSLTRHERISYLEPRAVLYVSSTSFSMHPAKPAIGLAHRSIWELWNNTAYSYTDHFVLAIA